MSDESSGYRRLLPMEPVEDPAQPLLMGERTQVVEEPAQPLMMSERVQAVEEQPALPLMDRMQAVEEAPAQPVMMGERIQAVEDQPAQPLMMGERIEAPLLSEQGALTDPLFAPVEDPESGQEPLEPVMRGQLREGTLLPARREADTMPAEPRRLEAVRENAAPRTFYKSTGPDDSAPRQFYKSTGPEITPADRVLGEQTKAQSIPDGSGGGGGGGSDGGGGGSDGGGNPANGQSVFVDTDRIAMAQPVMGSLTDRIHGIGGYVTDTIPGYQLNQGDSYGEAFEAVHGPMSRMFLDGISGGVQGMRSSEGSIDQLVHGYTNTEGENIGAAGDFANRRGG